MRIVTVAAHLTVIAGALITHGAADNVFVCGLARILVALDIAFLISGKCMTSRAGKDYAARCGVDVPGRGPWNAPIKYEYVLSTYSVSMQPK
eukprot:1377765-Heterocapsa_arctica.AAC.1